MQTHPLSAKDNLLFAQTQHLLRLSRAILKCHQAAERDSRAPAALVSLPSLRETWKRDEEGMRKLLEYGRVFGQRVVEGWITPSTSSPRCSRGHSRAEEEDDDGSSGGEGGNGGGEEMSEAENLARGLFEWRRKGRGLMGANESWGVAARRQMVALAGVVRTLPSRDGEVRV